MSTQEEKSIRDPKHVCSFALCRNGCMGLFIPQENQESTSSWEQKLQLIYCEKCGKFINDNIKTILGDFMSKELELERQKARSEGYEAGLRDGYADMAENLNNLSKQ